MRAIWNWRDVLELIDTAFPFVVSPLSIPITKRSVNDSVFSNFSLLMNRQSERNERKKRRMEMIEMTAWKH
jgi:hypothetical protein